MTACLLAVVLALLQLPSVKHLVVVSSSNTNTAAAGSRISLYVDVTPNPGIHVYAPGAKGYLPIGLKMDATRDVTAGALSYPRSQTLMFEGQKIPVYDKPFRLAQQVTLNRSLKAGETVTLTGAVNYQACTDQVCFIPATAPVRWTVSVSR